MPKRIEYLDIARGIGILLVVLGHNDFGAISPFFHRVIYSFHIPLFFFLSGYFINASISFFEYSRKRFHSILKPYLFTIFLIYFASVSFEKMGFQTALGRIVKSLYGSIDYIDWAQLWFLPNLFVVSLYAFIFIILVGSLQNRWMRWAVLLGTLAISGQFLHTFYPFSLSVFGREYELYGLPFSLDLILLLISLVVYPKWPISWLQKTGGYAGLPLLLSLPLGPILLLALLRYRDRRAWLLITLALMPQRVLYDQLPLFLIATNGIEIVFLLFCSWLTLPVLFESGGWGQMPINWQFWIVLTLYLPALLVLLRADIVRLVKMLIQKKPSIQQAKP